MPLLSEASSERPAADNFDNYDDNDTEFVKDARNVCYDSTTTAATPLMITEFYTTEATL